MRRAISWAYCAPKSTTRTVGKSTGSAPDGEVDALELSEVGVPVPRHRPAQRTEEVGPDVRRLRRFEQDLLQRPGGRQGGRGPAARQPRVRGDRVPPHAGGRYLAGDPQRLAELDGVRAAGQRPRDGTARLDPAVGDDVHVPAAGLVEVVAAGGRGGGERAGQRHPGGHARVGGGGAVVGGAADDDRDVQVGDELLEVERGTLRRDVLGGDGGALDDQQVYAGRQRC